MKGHIGRVHISGKHSFRFQLLDKLCDKLFRSGNSDRVWGIVASGNHTLRTSFFALSPSEADSSHCSGRQRGLLNALASVKRGQQSLFMSETAVCIGTAKFSHRMAQNAIWPHFQLV
ncbi:hypothetical protein BpHYR1_003556 [Brachionus plicatilis]|uniref:Uncharacterized protein n=1 Tax=Brachionus plicatilis TaxID=10195 RepID=A0A3M7QDV8_BRAPC|nr:hypothetical protein BpHYR1_003556 [Brachionus plicatilis]